jgi:phytoene dehydrogenase-like protein
MLLDNARDKGAEVREETTVQELLMENGRVSGARVTNKKG